MSPSPPMPERADVREILPGRNRPAAAPALRLHGSIARDIGTAILTRRYAPGDLLPNEIDFSERLRVSRTAYREALRILAAKGLVSSRPRSGTRVNTRDAWNFLDPDVLRWIFEAGQPEIGFIRELFELRQIVEPAAASLAADRRTDAQLRQMESALAEMERRTLATEAGRDADRAFHALILQATGNEALSTLASGIAAAVRWTTLFKARGGSMPRDPLPDHHAVLAAVAARDGPGARTAMGCLVDMALADILAVEAKQCAGR